MSQSRQKLLLKLQNDFPLCPRPFKAIAQELGLSEKQVIEETRRMKKARLIRYLGATFNLNQLGFESTLVAMRVPAARLKRVAAIINRNPGVTHNYLRKGQYNLWFTLTAPSGRLASQIEELKSSTGIADVLNLKTEKVFKIDTCFKLW